MTGTQAAGRIVDDLAGFDAGVVTERAENLYLLPVVFVDRRYHYQFAIRESARLQGRTGNRYPFAVGHLQKMSPTV
jgi:hypothetical protein